MATVPGIIKGDIPGKQEVELVDLITGECMGFQFIPLELDYSPDSNFAAIQTIGRNNAKYHFTGSEDTLSFELSYVADELNRQDVIKRCKWVESLSKSDGYKDGPHPVRLLFGEMFNKASWLVKAAPYTLSLFNKEFGYLPTLAKQKITLVRVTERNRTLKEVIDYQT